MGAFFILAKDHAKKKLLLLLCNFLDSFFSSFLNSHK